MSDVSIFSALVFRAHCEGDEVAMCGWAAEAAMVRGATPGSGKWDTPRDLSRLLCFGLFCEFRNLKDGGGSQAEG